MGVAYIQIIPTLEVVKISWDKNTIDCSHIDSIVETLKTLGCPYSLSVLGEAIGIGFNDEGDKSYPLRRLEYDHTVILERMERTSDCDTDDLIFSYPFDWADEPFDWQYEITEVNS